MYQQGISLSSPHSTAQTDQRGVISTTDLTPAVLVLLRHAWAPPTKTLFQAVATHDLAALSWWRETNETDIYKKDKQGDGLIHHAIRDGNPSIISYLLARGADLNSSGADNKTAWECLIFTNSAKKRENGLAAIRDYQQRMDSPFWEAVIGDLKGLQGWLNAHTQPLTNSNIWHKKDSKGRSALHYACICGHLEIVQCLLRPIAENGGGSNVTEEDTEGMTALHFAVVGGHKKVIQWMLRPIVQGGGGANITEKNNYGETALLFAAKACHFSIVHWLLQSIAQGGGGANIGERDLAGMTILLYAAQWGDLHALEWLLQPMPQGGGASITDKTEEGDTVYQLVKSAPSSYAVIWLDLYEALESVRSYHPFIQDTIKLVTIGRIDINSRVSITLATIVATVTSDSDTLLSANKKFILLFCTWRLLLGRGQTNRMAPYLEHLRVWAQALSHQFKRSLLKLAKQDDCFLWVHHNLLQSKNISMLKIAGNRINKLEMQYLFNLLKTNPIKALIFDNCHLSDVALASLQLVKLVEFAPQLELLHLVDCGLSGESVLTLAQHLPITLKLLNISGNRLDYKQFIKLLAMLRRYPALNELNVSDALIEQSSEEEFSQDLKQYLYEHPLESILIGSNFLRGGSENADRFKVLQVLLLVLQRPAKDLVRLVWQGLSPDEGGFFYSLCYRLDMDNESQYVRFTRHQVEVLDEYRKKQRYLDFSEVMRDLQGALKSSLLFSPKLSNESNALQDERSQKRLAKQLLYYHPEAPLKSHLRRNPRFFSPCPTQSISSCLFPAEAISYEVWKIYLFAHQEGKHAMLGWEGITRYGQRVFRVAHLQAVKKEGILAGYNMAISYYDLPIAKCLKKLKTKYHIAAFDATREQVKRLAKAVEKETLEPAGVEGKYSSMIMIQSLTTEKDKQNEAVNCVKWAVEIINSNAQLNIPLPFGALPISTITSLPQYRPFRDNASDRLTELDGLEDESLGENQPHCSVM